MEFVNDNASLDIIIGPMFSGKTTELLRRLTIFSKIGRVLYVNSALDTRKEENFSTHNDMIKDVINHIDMIKTLKITEILNIIENYDIIGIDEAQFFEDLMICNTIVDVMGKKVIIAGLNGNSNRETFGHVIDLIPSCDTISKLFSFCKVCSDKGNIKAGIFSKKIVNDTDNISIGAEDKYIPVCRTCYNN